MSKLDFTLEKTEKNARAAVLHTLHGRVQTPIFMPVGTQATVKSQTVEGLEAAGSRVLLANTYHLYLRPGAEVFRRMGGIHRFMNWKGPVLTDSGGFQIFSLPHSRQMREEGAVFQSYLDGTSHLFSPEVSIEMQKAIGSDIMMVLDQCIPSTADRPEAIAAMHLTHRWAKRSLAARGESPQSLFGIVQGACFEDLRRESADFLTALDFDGFAIGGLAVGESKAQREDFTELTASKLPSHLPRYLMGVGTPLDILEAVYRGVDMFDCIMPSQLAQRGGAYTSKGKLQLRRSLYKFADEPLDASCPCPTCAHYSKAYLHHLYKANETLGWTLLTSHNLTFYHRLMADIRATILQGTFEGFYRERREALALSDNTELSAPPKRASKEIRSIGNYELVESSQGYFSVRQTSSQETMHSVSNPCDEANRLYVEQSHLESRVRTQTGVLRLWDVGLGAATNAMAAIRCLENAYAQGPGCPVEIVSFENDLDSLRLGLTHPGKFPHLCHAAPPALLRTGLWQSPCGNIRWTLVQGNFAETFRDQAVPDCVFYDPFSFKTDPELWALDVFRQLRAHFGNHSVELFTYSASTAVRSALLSAGFYVAGGVGTGPKKETTIALTQPLSDKHTLLGSDWFARWNRSGAKFPAGMDSVEQAQVESLVRRHPQFELR